MAGTILMIDEAERLVTVKRPMAADGSPYGAKGLQRGALYGMLQNRLYRGEIVHKGAVYPGEHRLVVEATLFDTVQATLAVNRIERGAPRRASRARSPVSRSTGGER